ncbi:MAG TPA: isochorismatase family protein [Cytophagaceae bacterium]|nr:isochorismatase family protein [Cytophagaceae bacterium]
MITAIDKNTALVLIDFQKGILGYKLAHPISSVLEKAALLVEAFRKEDLPVVVVNVVSSGAWRTTRKDVPSPVNNLYSPEFSEISEKIKTEPFDIFITKEHWSAFGNTPLHEELQKRKITGIVLAGVSTSKGVEGTARAASERAYNISFATDAMTDPNGEAHKNSIEVIFPGLGERGTSEEIIEKLKNRK